ncbi:alpha-tubulin N-acetyltransferase 1 isoform X4 [Bombyx mori]|uniref:Alpha-tubulin N-acetyltransferase n=2 Tax=Bombyx mori TaxID=7091 RepID=A0A8R2ARA9_BOMMO|nr:alpha-tubulin N-acetyltransferase 1 isoform X4 [Bombyx mori]
MARRYTPAKEKLYKFVEICTMEWMVPVNEMLRDEITRIDYNLMTDTFEGNIRTVRMLQDSLSKLIDVLGEYSSAAQGLNRVITTGEKLRLCPSHVVYILKDKDAKNGEGEAVGMLKIGRKHLFLFDDKEQVRELEPLCVLDFYVVCNRQRTGCGKKLFDFMLKDTESDVHALAIDGPSHKMEQFLKRNYGVERLVRQNNNFAVSPKFFTFTTAELNKAGRPVSSLPPVIGRFAAPRRPSAIANVIHGGNGLGYRQDSPNGNELDKLTFAPPARSPAPGTELGRELDDDEDEESDWEDGAGVGPVPTRPSQLEMEEACAALFDEPSPAGSSTSRRDSQLTDRGYFDVKFYHNKLW